MESVPGESRDHLHHRGLWFSYDDVNGVKFWENDPSYTKGRIGRIVVRNAEDGDRSGTLTAAIEWRDPGDTKEGAFAIRLADNFTQKKGGRNGGRGRATRHGEHLGEALELG